MRMRSFFERVDWAATALVIFFAFVMGGTFFSFYADKKNEKIFQLEKKVKEDSTKMASLEAGVVRATGNAVVHDTIIKTEKIYLGDDDALSEIN